MVERKKKGGREGGSQAGCGPWPGGLTVSWGKWIRKPMYYTVVTALTLEAWIKNNNEEKHHVCLRERYFSRRGFLDWVLKG